MDRMPKICACGRHGFAALTLGQTALYSPSDHGLVEGRRWYASWRPNGRFYAVRETFGKTVYMHRVIAGGGSPEIDHANRDSLDNTNSNLLRCDRQSNQANRRVRGDNSHGLKGVRRIGARYYARIRVNGLWINHPGGFTTAKEAAAAYDTMARKHFGEAAATNADLGLLT